MAFIDYRDGYFVGVGSWEERGIWKAAGFKWSPTRKEWQTDRLEAASKPDVVWTPEALDHVENSAKVAELSHGLSYSASTTFEPPVPSGIDPGTGRPFAFRPFQKAGVEYAILRRDTLIADQPGLGKTLQAIGTFNADPSATSVLIVCPASLKENWRREFEKWKTRGVSVGIAETQVREKIEDGHYKNGKPKFRTVVRPTVWPDTDVVIINYDILDRFSDEINGATWDLLICDEAHALKSADSNRTLFILGGRKFVKFAGGKRKALSFQGIDASRRVFLSGTPMMNRPIELWPICKAFDPNGLGKNYNDYAYRYCGAFIHPAHGGLDVSGATNLEELGQLLRAKFMIRRLKRDVLPELPEVTRSITVLDSAEIKEIVAREDDLARTLRLYEANLSGAGEQGAQIIEAAEAYGLTSDDGPQARELKIDYAAAVLGLEPPAVAVLFEEIAQVRRELGVAKMSAVIPWVQSFLEGADDKLILFAYHSDVVLGLSSALAKFNPAVIYGGTPQRQRQLEVDRFQTDPSCRLMIGNLQAAGVGLTMTAAHDVAFAEGDWVPANIEQAIDRANRIGQLSDRVSAHFLVANGSLDARIAQSAAEKSHNITTALDH